MNSIPSIKFGRRETVVDVQPIAAVSPSDMQPAFAPANRQYITTIRTPTAKVGASQSQSQSQDHAHRKFRLKDRNPSTATTVDNSPLVTEKTENGSIITAEAKEGRGNAVTSLKLKLKSLKRKSENQLQVMPEAKRQKTIAPRLNISSINATEENASSNGDDRERVRKALRTYDALRRNLMNENESCKEAGGGTKRADLKAGSMMNDRGQCINRGRRCIGSVPGVQVGDHFYFRMELCVIGLHAPSQAGIDYITAQSSQWNEPVAISIIASGGYEDDDEGEVLIYSGQGGNNWSLLKKRSVTDQKLERGNLALERSKHHGVEIRVIRGIKDSRSPSGKIFIYDGLYKIECFWIDKASSGCDVFKYRLQRLPGQPELGSAILKNTRAWISQPLSRVGLLHSDISFKSEKLPICLANTVDNEKGPSHFEYTRTCLMYPNSLVQLDSSEGCECIGGCDPSVQCSCVQRNGKQMPYNSKGILTNEKPLIYECNEYCRCPPSCRNRVTQRGLNVHLEVFRTSDKGWGVRPWDPIAAGTFICEYTGQVIPIEEQAAHCHSDNEYILNLKHAQERWTEWSSVSDILCEQKQQQHASCQTLPGLNFVLDASKSGNASRFLKNSSSPNVFMQFVLHDHLDIRFPHIMLFARENIPPLTELTFDYGSVPSERGGREEMM